MPGNTPRGKKEAAGSGNLAEGESFREEILVKLMRSRGCRQGNPLQTCCSRAFTWQKGKGLDYILDLDAGRQHRPGPRTHGDKQ